MKVPFELWINTIKRLMESIGYGSIELSGEWRLLYDDGLSPFKAFSESEFGGKLTWAKYRKLQHKHR